MEQVQKGNLHLAGLLFERYKRVLFSFLYNQTNDQVTSEDLLQETFYRLIKYKHNYTQGKSFKAWIFTIARNAMYDSFRKNNKKKMQNIDSYKDHFIAQDSADTNIELEEKNKFLQKAMMSLSAEKREILTLVKLKEKKYKEVAEILNIKESAVKSKVFRAIQQLQKNYSTLQHTI